MEYGCKIVRALTFTYKDYGLSRSERDTKVAKVWAGRRSVGCNVVAEQVLTANANRSQLQIRVNKTYHEFLYVFQNKSETYLFQIPLVFFIAQLIPCKPILFQYLAPYYASEYALSEINWWNIFLLYLCTVYYGIKFYNKIVIIQHKRT